MSRARGLDKHMLVSNTAISGLASILKLGVQIVMLPMMAYLVGPAEFGIFALIMPIISFLNLLADGGLGESLARVDELDRAAWSTGFWTIMFSCIIVSILMLLCGHALAIITGQTRIVRMIAVLSPTFVCLALSAIPHARLTRRGLLKIHVLSDLVGVLVGSALAVSLAMRGYGAWSLIWQYIAYAVCRMVVLNFNAYETPSIVFNFAALKPHLSTGSAMVAARLSDFIGRILENTIFGAMFGTSALGYYSFANQTSRYIVEMFSNPLWGSLYAFSLRSSWSSIVTVHRKTTRILSNLAVPAAFLFAAGSQDILPIFLGQKWGPSSEIISIILPSYVFTALAVQLTAILYAVDMSWSALWPTCVLFASRVVVVCCGYYIGLTGVIWAISGVNLVYTVLSFLAARRIEGLVLTNLLFDVFLSAFSAAISVVFYKCIIALLPIHTLNIYYLFSLGLSYLFSFMILFLMDKYTLQKDVMSIRYLLLRGKRRSGVQ